MQLNNSLEFVKGIEILYHILSYWSSPLIRTGFGCKYNHENFEGKSSINTPKNECKEEPKNIIDLIKKSIRNEECINNQVTIKQKHNRTTTSKIEWSRKDSKLPSIKIGLEVLFLKALLLL